MLIASAIVQKLREHGIRWTRDGLALVPSEIDVSNAIDEAKAVLDDSEAGTQYQRGGLIIRKETSATYDVYVYVGSL